MGTATMRLVYVDQAGRGGIVLEVGLFSTAVCIIIFLF